MPLPKQLTTITPLSKYLAMFLFITLPFIGFFVGINYQSKIDQYKQVSYNSASKMKPFLNVHARSLIKSITPAVSPSISVSQINDPSALVLEQLIPSLNLSTKVDVTSAIDFWIDQDGILIPLKGFSFDIGQDNVTLVPSGGSYTVAQLSPIEKVTQKYFQLAGYQVDVANTVFGKSLTYSVYHRFGFTKGNMKCVVHMTASQDPFGTFFCGTIDTEQFALQQPFYSLFNMKIKSLNGVTNDQGLSGVTVNGIFAQGQVVGGYAWLAKKINGTWQLIWDGQQAPECSVLQKYQVPQSFIGCIN